MTNKKDKVKYVIDFLIGNGLNFTFRCEKGSDIIPEIYYIILEKNSLSNETLKELVNLGFEFKEGQILLMI